MSETPAERKPYAYSWSDYGGTSVYPSIEAFVAEQRANGAVACNFACLSNSPLRAHYADGTSEPVGEGAYLERVNVNWSEIARFIDQKREESFRSCEEMWKDKPMNSRWMGFQPFFEGNREEQIMVEIKLRSWKWKDAPAATA